MDVESRGCFESMLKEAMMSLSLSRHSGLNIQSLLPTLKYTNNNGGENLFWLTVIFVVY